MIQTVEAVAYVEAVRLHAEDDFWGGEEVCITLVEHFTPEALQGIADFSHVEVFPPQHIRRQNPHLLRIPPHLRSLRRHRPPLIDPPSLPQRNASQDDKETHTVVQTPGFNDYW
jgi:hypothetical protein